MEKEKVIELIAGRIIDEYKKHCNTINDWNKIAASKIYSQWFEYLNDQITELDKKILIEKECNAMLLKQLIEKDKEIESLKERVIFLNEAHNDLINTSKD